MDEALIASFQAGDPEAIRLLYAEYAGPIATVARSVVGSDQALIDEVVQTTFTKAWRAASTFEGNRRLAPWLYAIARRAAIDAVRMERRPTRGDHEAEVELAVPPPSIEQTWEAYEVRRALDALPAEEREVMAMSHLLSMTHGEIAERLSIPIGTVKSRSHRAHRRLQAALAHVVNVDGAVPTTPTAENQSPTLDVRLKGERR
ncbi:MAG: RNA polymerase sigma factor [Acidimicrobiales bacterium]